MVYEIDVDAVHVRKLTAVDTWKSSLSETLDEWNSPGDNEAFSDLCALVGRSDSFSIH